ncbi:lantibiotic dehydratase [Streptomyces sp. NPDC059477]|uniref:lantibiotic dehydratase n=1 Tax=Streptomyces sp. NPDC059477 TaxID=3346847 RepID=UPI0036756524
MLLRAPLWPWEGTVVDPAGEDTDALLTFLRRARAPLLDEAIEISSPPLAATLRRVAAGHRPKPGEVRRAALALSRYLIRAGSRATPFGLLAGVGLLEFGPATDLHHGDGHRRVVGPDLGALVAAVRPLETDPAILPRLRLHANNLAVNRGERLILPVPVDAGTAPVRLSVRRTPVVEAVMETAAGPVPYPELLERVGARFPGAPEGAVAELVARLIDKDLLLTDLRPPADHPDPLAHVLSLAPEAEELRRWRAAAGERAERAVRVGERGERGESAEGPPHGEGGSEKGYDDGHFTSDAFAVNVRLEVKGTIDAAVGTEAAAAAQVLWRLSKGARPHPLREYHEEFIERYGGLRTVPLLELLDPERGLGAPAGYRFPAGHRTAPRREPDPRRDALLADLALAALRDGTELVLDDTVVDRLAPGPVAPPPRGGDLFAELAARDATALDAGDFTLVLAPGPGCPTPGAALGRFAQLLGGPDVLRAAAVAPRPGTLSAQLVFSPMQARHRNVTGAPHWLPHRIVAGTFGGDRPGDIPLSDLAVRADGDRLRVLSLSRGAEVEVFQYSMLVPEAAPNAARFLQDVASMGDRTWALWHWGALTNLPALPRVRHRRTVLAPARWRCSDPRLGDRALTGGDWAAALADWRARWRVPDLIRVGTGDRQLRLDLRRPWHRALLRTEIDAHDDPTGVTLREDPAAGGGGWLGEGVSTAEIVVSLRTANATGVGPPVPVPVPVSVPMSVCAPVPAPAPGSVRESMPVPVPVPVPAPVPVRGSGAPAYAPGSEWLYARLYAGADEQRELLAGPMADFASGLPPEADEWFVIRYADPAPHLRLRVHGRPDILAARVFPRLGAWAADLRARGAAGRLELSTYEPEYERYGGTAMLPLAHRVFHTDSALGTALLREGVDRAGAAPWIAGTVCALDLVGAFLQGTQVDPLTWLTENLAKDEERQARFRPHRRALLTASSLDPDHPPALLDRPGLRTPRQARRTALAAYGAALHTTGGETALHTPLRSLLHMHHNRLIGIDPDSERTLLAACRGVAQARADRKRAGA